MNHRDSQGGVGPAESRAPAFHGYAVMGNRKESAATLGVAADTIIFLIFSACSRGRVRRSKLD